MRTMILILLLTGCQVPQDRDDFDLHVKAEAGECSVVVEGVQIIRTAPDNEVDLDDVIEAVKGAGQ